MNALPKTFKHGRIKDKYNPEPTTRERGFHVWLMTNYACFCGCNQIAECVHHVLGSHPEKRWRRDHEFVVPATNDCHARIHAAGKEAKAFPTRDIPAMAAAYRQDGYEAGAL